MPSSFTPNEATARPRAVLVAVQLPGMTEEDHESDLAELGRLVHTLGFDVVAHRDASGATRSPPPRSWGMANSKSLRI